MSKKSGQKENIVNPFSKMEEEVLTFWEKGKIFQKSVKREAEKGDYVFYDGPPFATGEPHYGHIVASLIKDVVPRYWTMHGYRVERKWGWDCHGLPIENIAEKELRIKKKKDIEEMGVLKFNEFCRSKVLEYVDIWKKVIKRLGRWADMENSYKTMDLNFMESVWWVFKELWGKGLIYEGYRSMHICPRCETTLSQQEVAEGYKTIKDLSATVKFKLLSPLNKGGKGDLPTYILAWTTTPWTLIGNVALAINEKIVYVKIKNSKIKKQSRQGGTKLKNNEYYILAKDRVKEILKDEDFEIEEKFKGKKLISLAYEPLFDYYFENTKLENRENGWKIYAADFVTTAEGTGVVHIAPAFGEDDMNLGKKYNLPFIQHINMGGAIKPEVRDFAGLNVKPANDPQKTDVEIIKFLARQGALFAKEKYEHSYPHCWRCETPLINYATTSWFVNVLKIKGKALKLAEKINWSPAHIKEGRFGHWLEGARDWSISRQRYWASVIPIWRCSSSNIQHPPARQAGERAGITHNKACGNIKVIGSIKELEELSREKITDLHKYIIDKITFKCEKCGGEMRRIPDVLDCWFESGSMPYAQMHYPFENKEKFEKNFPAEFIAEGVDQTRAWFYYLHILATAVKQSHTFKNVIVNGIVLAEDGKKMSKRLQNYPDPTFIFEKYGADAMRFYLLSSPVMAAENLNFSEDGVKEALQKNIILLWNVYKFYAMFIDNILLIRGNEGINNSGAMSSTPASPCLLKPVCPQAELCKRKNILDQWIMARLNELTKEVTANMNAYNLPRAVRPITDFINDLSTWYIRRSRDRFKGDDENDKRLVLETTKHILTELAKVMAPFMPFIAEQIWQKVTGNNFKDENRSVHLELWPISTINNEQLTIDIIKEMEMVRKIVEMGLAKRDEAGIKIRQPLRQLKIKNLKLRIKEEYINLIKEEINVKNMEIEEGEGDMSVEIDTEITEELKREGIKRELVRFINALRKDAQMTIRDRAKIFYETKSEIVKKVIRMYYNEIIKDTLSNSIQEGIKEGAVKKEIKIANEKITLGIQKLN